jgi:cobaltochelatase CobS
MNMEERDLTGQWTVKGGETHFNLGPLPMAMKYGLTYCADEYDVALPAVLMVYQPVLEGKPLIIKDADPENRIIRPHPNFRFIATGNTNGMGDETGLYQGTLIQNAANYERFGITEEMLYPPEAVEIPLVQGQARVPVAIAQKLVKIAAMCREAYRAGKLSLPPSPRALIRAGQNGKRLGDWARGLQLAYTNRLTRVDQQAVNEIVQRVGLTS